MVDVCASYCRYNGRLVTNARCTREKWMENEETKQRKTISFYSLACHFSHFSRVRARARRKGRESSIESSSAYRYWQSRMPTTYRQYVRPNVSSLSASNKLFKLSSTFSQSKHKKPRRHQKHKSTSPGKMENYQSKEQQLNALSSLQSTILKNRALRKAKSIAATGLEFILAIATLLSAVKEEWGEFADPGAIAWMVIAILLAVAISVGTLCHAYCVTSAASNASITNKELEDAYARTNKIPIVDGILEIPLSFRYGGACFVIACWCSFLVFFFGTVVILISVEGASDYAAAALLAVFAFFHMTGDLCEYWVHTRPHQQAPLQNQVQRTIQEAPRGNHYAQDANTTVTRTITEEDGVRTIKEEWIDGNGTKMCSITKKHMDRSKESVRASGGDP